jgi:hypothetical protein
VKPQLSPRWWDAFWFADGSPYDLAGARIVVSLQALWLLLSRDIPAVAALPDGFWAPVRSQLWRYLIFPGHVALEYALQSVAIAALVAAALGVRPRVSCLLAALLLYHLGPVEAVLWWGDPGERGFEVPILGLVVLAVAPCDEVWSVGRLGPGTRTEAWRYRWPLLLVQSFFAWIYVLGAYGKLYHGGLAWISGQNIRELIWFMNVWPGTGPFERFGPWLASLPVVPAAIAVGTIAFEFTFPLVMVSRNARRIIIPAAFVFHAGIVPAMNLAFPNTMLLLLFVNWDWLRARWRQAGRPVPPVAGGS